MPKDKNAESNVLRNVAPRDGLVFLYAFRSDPGGEAEAPAQGDLACAMHAAGVSLEEAHIGFELAKSLGEAQAVTLLRRRGRQAFAVLDVQRLAADGYQRWDRRFEKARGQAVEAEADDAETDESTAASAPESTKSEAALSFRRISYSLSLIHI